MVIHWAGAMLCWLLGVAVQLQHARLGSWGEDLPVVALGLLMGLAGWRLRARSARHANGVGMLAIGLMAGCLGWGQTQWRAEQRALEAWPLDWADQTVDLMARIDEMPQRRPWGAGLTVQVIEVSRGGRQWRGGQRWGRPEAAATAVCPRRVFLSWSGADGVLKPGQIWRWRVQLHGVHGQSNPGGFDSELWMFERGVRAQGKVVRSASAKDADDGARPAAVLMSEGQWLDGLLIERWRTTLRDRVLAQLSDAQLAGMVIGLTVGDQGAILQDDWLVLRASGTAHLASISGLHITMMGWLVAALVSGGWRRSTRLMHWIPAPTAGRWMGLIGAWTYALLAGWGIPAQRTVLMLAMVTILRAGGRRWPWPLVLLAAAVAVTLLDPWSLTQAGFWLSFAAVGLLMLSGGDMVLLVDAPWAWQVQNAMRELLRTQAIASVGLAPLSLVFFQAVSLVGLLANLVCIPLFSFLITPLALLGYVHPVSWQLLAPVVHLTMAALTWLTRSPWAVVQGAEVCGWAAALGLMVGAWMLAPVPWRWKLAACPLMLPLLWPTSLSLKQPGPPQGEVQVMAVDIGQGTAVLVRTARHTLLYDTGPRVSPENDAGQRVLVGLLRSLGVSLLDELMISHGDADHVGGAVSVLRAVPTTQLRTSLPEGHEVRAWAPSGGRPLPHLPCLAGQQWSWDGVRFTVLHPTDADLSMREALSDNAVSCVLQVEAHGRRVLLTGDIEAAQEAALLARDPQALASEVLVVPHHGSHTSSTEDFLEAVHPQVAVIQSGFRNRYGHPHADVLARYEARQVPLRRTTDCGAWVWQSDWIDARRLGRCWRQRSPRYWQSVDATIHDVPKPY